MLEGKERLGNNDWDESMILNETYSEEKCTINKMGQLLLIQQNILVWKYGKRVSCSFKV